MEPYDYKKFLNDLKKITSNDFISNYIACLASSCGVLFLLTFFDFLVDYRYAFLVTFILGLVIVIIIKLKSTKKENSIQRCYTINIKEEINYDKFSNYFMNNEKYKRLNIYPFGVSYYHGPFDFVLKREKSPKMEIPVNLPQNGDYPSVIKYKSCYFYLNIYYFGKQNNFTMDVYKDKHDEVRTEIKKRFPNYGKYILDIIIVSEMTQELENYIKGYVNPRLTEASVMVVICGKEVYIPPIDLINARGYQKDFYKKILLYLLRFLEPINYFDTLEKDPENNIEIFKIK